jgi:hypothetical protein
MASSLLVSILVATIAIPIRFARARTARGGLRRVVLAMVLYIVLWALFCLFVFMRLGGGY